MRKSLIRLEIHKTAVSDIDHFIGLISASPYQKKKKKKASIVLIFRFCDRNSKRLILSAHSF